MNDVKGKWALVTGASRGIGREIALFMAKAGANVVVQSRQLAGTTDLVAEIKALGVDAYAVAGELSEEADVLQIVDTVLAKTQIDILFNNAGVQPKAHDDWSEMGTDEFIWTYKVNLMAPMIFIGAFLPGMIERGWGRIINTTSGIKNQPEQTAYAASKGALDKATKDFAKKLNGTDVTMNLADPGWIRTDLGGENAHHGVETVTPGMVVAAFLDDKKTGRWFSAQDFAGMSLIAAVEKAENQA